MPGIDTDSYSNAYKYSDTYMGLTHPRLTWMKDQSTRRAFFRDRIWRRDKGKCGICGERVEYMDMALDHIRARAMGGADHWDNLHIAHKSCNSRRSHRDIYPGRRRG